MKKKLCSCMGLVVVLAFLVALASPLLVAPAAQAAVSLTGTETRITTDLADQYDPAISGNIIVYTDNRGTDLDVWYYDLATGMEAPVTTAAGNQQLTDVSDGFIVYTDYLTTDVMLFSVADGTITNLTAAANSPSIAPGIGQGLVAWQDGRDGNWEIYARDLASGEERRISNSPATDERPQVNNGVIVWERGENFIMDIYSYDWASGITRQITDTPADDERGPDVCSRYVVYSGLRNGDKDIYLYDLTTGIEKRLALPGDQFRPKISGDYVSFEDLASGVSHICLWHLPSDTVFDLTAVPGGPPATSGQYLNDIDGNRIVYTDDRNGQLDVYMYEFQLASPSIQVSPASVAFGPVVEGNSASVPLTISNTGQADLCITGLSITPAGSPFSWALPPQPGREKPPADSKKEPPLLVIPPNESAEVTLTFSPTATGLFSGTLQIDGDDPLHPTVQVPLSGEGISSNTAPTVSLGPDAVINEGGTFTSTGSFADPNADTWTATVDYGDGSGVQPLALNPDKTFALSHVYADNRSDNGSYTVTVTVTDSQNGAGSDTLTLTVNNVAPTAHIVAVTKPNPLLPKVHTVTFQGSFNDPGVNDAPTATWNFGDNTPTASGTLVQHVYSAPGTYTVTLTVTDKDGATGTATTVVKVLTAREYIDAMKAYIRNLPDSAFKDFPGLRRAALLLELSLVSSLVDHQQYNAAILTLNFVVRPKMDGPLTPNDPRDDRDDWITAPQAQQDLCGMIGDTIAYLRTL